MKQEEFDQLMNMKPSEFYLWLWRKYSRKEITIPEGEKIAKKYEEHNAEMLEIISKDEVKVTPDFVIHEPIWETKSIGLAEDKLKDQNTIEIDYITKDGNRLYPETYTISKKKALTYPTKKVKNHTLRIIPIRELE